jgi:UDP-glucose:glycoprotein glucosyltransferase
MPGSLPPVRRDIFNLIVPVDFSNIEDVALVSEQLLMYVKRKFPVRFGIVPLASTPEAAEKAKVVYHLLENYGLIALAAYFDGVVAANGTKTTDQALFDAAIKDRTLRPEATALPYDEISISEHHGQQVRQAQHWAERLQANSEVPPVFINGFPIKRDVHWMQAMSQRLGQDLRMVQEALFYGKLEADTWIPKMFLQNALKRRNPYIYPEENNELHVWDINKVYTEHRELFAEIPVIEAAPESTLDDWATLTVIADLTDVEGKKLLTDALIFRQANPGLRVDVIHNPVDSDRSSAVNTALNSDEVNLLEVQSLDDLEMILARAKPRGSRTFEHFLPRFLTDAAIRPGDNMLALNGHLIGSIVSASQFVQADFEQFLDSERTKRILPVYAALADLNLTDKVSGPLDAAKMTSVTALSTISDLPEGIFESAPTLRISAFNVWNSTHTAFETGDESTATIHFVAVINPATEQGQRWAPILKVLSELDGVYMKIWLNPRDQLTELPVKRFFRSVLKSSPSFDDAGKVQSLTASFKGLPSEALLTAAVDVPPAWLVSSKVSVHDLDNIKLSSIKADVEAVYELENILIEGHSREIPSARPPPGLQLVLATEDDPHFADTIVMENLGFFQFKANPGYYNLHLEEGRSSDIFRLESVGAQGMAPVPGDNGTEVILMDFMGTTLYPRVVRKPGMEGEEVLMGLAEDEPAKPSDLLSKGLKFAEGILGGSKKPKKEVVKSVSDTEHAEVNIFSVASGHLYERMLNIMMVSVMRHTNHTVKFWFIEQFLSPSFKDFIPTMAEEYGFKYEMVTYKWPHWLRGQKEKQREIWGYKILFLDVLFPLNLDKVIFVDADQIVRTDMYDLVQLDLHGAPYGFTPMCDSRTEMEGFRFWKQGYWATYLRDLPYHISALYVVDLRRFRALASGDRLRQTYHQLSADPASLANLDQDLPNHMQYQIPIFSLPQDWLWCETWCSDEALGTAKTIDLCNNPLTKEPKLDRARRQVPEWTVYDDEIAGVARRRREKLSGGDAAHGEGQKVLGEIPRGEDQEAHIKDEL